MVVEVVHLRIIKYKPAGVATFGHAFLMAHFSGYGLFK